MAQFIVTANLLYFTKIGLQNLLQMTNQNVNDLLEQGETILPNNKANLYIQINDNARLFFNQYQEYIKMVQEDNSEPDVPFCHPKGKTNSLRRDTFIKEFN
uniref:Uncharacterized protein orf100 n=1 Tax=Chaetosphaeridium globosum TaxID=96477 RepID=Q8LVU5_CHAGL|nr:hypothetical protein ChglCp079 [Chaetosphaeridium globosum]NP_683864.1 hypothetical protein ChglCp098 [Chaetosphaeridium globosum]AAM96592.1 hypothetical protein [Chaetosphaeridium globosum]AAM96594.1 hypothetical protein [Chaetosphaeridium globosum]